MCCPVIFHWCGGGVFDLSLRRGWLCVVGVLFVVSVVIEEYCFVAGTDRAMVVAVAGVLDGSWGRYSKATGSVT